MKILAFKPKHGILIPYVVQDCVEAFKQLGHSVKVIDLEGFGELKAESICTLNNLLNEFHPDFVFTLHHIGLDAEPLTTKKIPSASWYVDDPFHSSSLITKKEPLPHQVIFICEKTYIEKLKDFGFRHVFYLPLATNPKRFKLKLTQEEEERYTCNISFAGLSFWPYYKKYYEDKEGILDPMVRTIIDEVLKLQIQSPLLDITDIINEVERIFQYPLEVDDRRAFETCLKETAVSKHQKDIIETISHLGLDLYGDEGWRNLISGQVRFRGMIAYDDLPKLYSASKINLNRTKIYIKTAVNQRTYDILACGAFMLTDYRRDLGELFDLEKEIVCYRNKEELQELAEYFLNHPEERRKIAIRGQRRVLNEHTYEIRMERLIEIMRRIFSM